jgi:hypothetical protein
MGRWRHLRRKSIPHSDYLFRTATHWGMRAEAMRTVAEDAQDPKVRSMMLRIAAGYDRLAANADDRAARVVRPDDKRSADAAIGFLDRPQEREALGGGRGKIA